MPSTTNFNWTTPADTDLVKDGALAIRTLANGIDTSLVDLKGGTTGQYLKKNSNTDLDYIWGDVTAGANWSLLNTGGTALTGATTITVSGISSKDKILILVAGASSANASSSLTIRFNADTGSNYNSYGSFLNAADTGADGVRLANSFSNTSSTSIPFGTTFNDASGTVSGGLTLTGGASSGVKQFIFTGAGAASGGQSGQQTYSGQGIYSGSSTISSVSIISSTGNFDAGTIYVYTSA